MTRSGLRRDARAAIEALREYTNEERRLATLSYFPSAMENLGVAVPDIRRVLRAVKREVKDREDAEVLDLARAILAEATLEGRQLGYELVASRPSLVRALTIAELRELGTGMDNWASTDTFSTSLAGQSWREGRLTDAEVARWSRSEDRWWRRASLASTIPLNMASRGGSGDPERTLTACERLADDPDEMVAKALSWALRSLVPIDPVRVEDFLAEHQAALAKRVLREVRKKLETGRKR